MRIRTLGLAAILAAMASASGAADDTDPLLAGMKTYQADAAIFAECKSGDTYPIAQEGDYLTLERAYLADRAAPGDALYVMVEGEIAERPTMEGPDRDTLVVDRFIRTRTDTTCERQMADAELRNTYWRLDVLEGEPFPEEIGRDEAHILLETGEEGVYRAMVGCNSIRGGYTSEDGVLNFSGGAMTMMACPEPLGSLERQFTLMLSEVTGFAIEGETLVLKDVEGLPRAVFSAIYF